MPFTNAQAENINIYGWQNWSYEWLDIDTGGSSSRDIDRLSNNAANIGFMAHMDTGISGLQVGFRCEQFTYWGRNNHLTGWCNRNSKISLRHETMGELMFGQWLLPYNEIVAQWVDPFYDAGADSHTSIMGNIGGTGAAFYNGSFTPGFDQGTYGALTFNRRQEGVIQYVWPNTSAMASQSRDGFQFRAAVTQGSGVDTDTAWGANLDPRIFSTGIAYQHNMGNNQFWLAVAYEHHEDLSAKTLGDVAWTARTNAAAAATALAMARGQNPTQQAAAAAAAVTALNNMGHALCSDSEDEGYRIAGRYKFDWGGGQSTWIAAMYEELDYEASGCTQIDGSAFAANDIGPAYIDAERDAWMISGKHAFGNGLDFRFSYMDADEVESDIFQATDDAADAFNLGVFYTMPAGTELRATYSEVSNDDEGRYNFGINGAPGLAVGGDVEMFAVGIVHWFD